MPVRVYEIGKKLGLESKEVLAKARELGITAARVPSSSLDKITAEYLEEHLAGTNTQNRKPPIVTSLDPIFVVGDSSSTPLLEPKSSPPRPTPAPSTQFVARDDSFAIRLGRNTEVEIYTFEDESFRHVGSFAFEVGPPESATANVVPSFEPEPLVLLTNTEMATLEYKPASIWDKYQQRENPDLRKSVVKTVAAFLNTEGGTLLVGVADNGRVLGLKEDLARVQKPKADDYDLFLNNILCSALGADLSVCFRVRTQRLKDKDVCCVGVRRAPKPVWVKEGGNEIFYIRVGNSSRPLAPSAAVDYCKTRFA